MWVNDVIGSQPTEYPGSPWTFHLMSFCTMRLAHRTALRQLPIGIWPRYGTPIKRNPEKSEPIDWPPPGIREN